MFVIILKYFLKIHNLSKRLFICKTIPVLKATICQIIRHKHSIQHKKNRNNHPDPFPQYETAFVNLHPSSIHRINSKIETHNTYKHKLLNLQIQQQCTYNHCIRFWVVIDPGQRLNPSAPNNLQHCGDLLSDIHNSQLD